MTEIYSEKAVSDLIYLVSCAVNSEKPNPKKCTAMDLRAVYSLAQKHFLTSAAAHALEEVCELPRPFEQKMKKTIRKLALFDIERGGITAAMEKAGIWYLPLKGIILKDLYPKSAMREMSDNDILCDPSRLDDVRRIMENAGFTCTMFCETNHDTYQKPPSLEFEMHRALFSEDDPALFSAYYSNIREKLIRDPDGCACRMTDEDFYIYLICHIYKHYRSSGTGLRSLLDIYIHNHSRYDSLNKDYLSDEFEKLKLSDFEKDMRRLSVAVFTAQPLDNSQQKELRYLIDSGCYGNENNADHNIMKSNLNGDDRRRSKSKYLLRRVFPRFEDIQKQYPFVYRHRILYPLLVICRPVKGIFTHPKGIYSEYKMVRQYKNSDQYGSHH